MYYLIGADGKSYGPLTASDIHHWMAEGRASKYSRVRRADEDNWQALGSIPELLPPREEVAFPGEEPAPVAVDAARAPERLDAGRCVARAWALVAYSWVRSGVR